MLLTSLSLSGTTQTITAPAGAPSMCTENFLCLSGVQSLRGLPLETLQPAYEFMGSESSCKPQRNNQEQGHPRGTGSCSHAPPILKSGLKYDITPGEVPMYSWPSLQHGA